MNQTMKTVLLVGGTAVATTVVIDLLTGGAVRAAFSEKMAAFNSGAKGGAEAVAEAASDAVNAVADGVATAAGAVAG